MTLVAMTGYGQDSDRQRSQEAGFDAHLVKPVNLDDLLLLLTQPDFGRQHRDQRSTICRRHPAIRDALHAWDKGKEARLRRVQPLENTPLSMSGDSASQFALGPGPEPSPIALTMLRQDSSHR